MKYFLLLSLFFATSTQAKIYDAFMCYTRVDTVVLFGVLKPQGTLRINYQRLEKNPTTIDLKIKKYSRADSVIEAEGFYGGKSVIEIKSKNGLASTNINLMPFPGAEDVSFNNEEAICYFGKFED